MSIRIHTTEAANLSMSVLDTDGLVELYGEEFSNIGHALVLEDGGNMEAMVLVGDDEDFLQFARDIVSKLHTDSNPWVDDAEFPVADWRYQVANDDTRSGYLDWVATQRESGRAFQTMIDETPKEAP